MTMTTTVNGAPASTTTQPRPAPASTTRTTAARRLRRGDGRRSSSSASSSVLRRRSSTTRASTTTLLLLLLCSSCCRVPSLLRPLISGHGVAAAAAMDTAAAARRHNDDDDGAAVATAIDEARRRLQVTRGNNNSNSSSSTDVNACVLEYANFTTCVDTYRSNSSSSSSTTVLDGCDDCVVSYWNVTLSSTPPPAVSPLVNSSALQQAFCEQLQDGTCEGWFSCRKECPRKCKTQLVHLVNCISNCQLTPLQQCPQRTINGTDSGSTDPSPVPAIAPSTPTPAPSLALSTPPPTPAPVPTVPVPVPVPTVPQVPSQPILEVCDRQRNDLQSCWLAQEGSGSNSNTGELNQCTRCLLQHLSGYNSSTLCVQYQQGVCASLSECPCGSCDSQQLAFLECLTACTFQCPNTGGGGSTGGSGGVVPTSSPIVLQPPVLPTRFPTPLPQQSQQTLSPVVRSDMVPTSTPATMSPTISNAVSSTACAQEKEAMNQCLGYYNDTGISPCEDCVVKVSWPATPSVCMDIENATCQGWDRCQEVCTSSITTNSSTNCHQEFFAYATCETACTFPCYDNATSASTPPPRNVSICQAEYNTFDNCVNPVRLGYACEHCVTKYWPIQSSTSPPLQCSVLDNATCWGLQECTNVCNGCDTELRSVVSCISDCNLTDTCTSTSPTVQVPSVAPLTATPSLGLSSPPPTTTSSSSGCSSFDQAVVQCFLDDNRNATPCGNCLAALSPDPCPTNGTNASLCDTFEQQCGTVCTPCQDHVQNAVDCYANLANCGAVQLVCTSSSSNGTNTSGTAETPTASPAPTTPLSAAMPTSVPLELCPDQKDAVDQCLSDQLDSGAKASCEACVESVYGKLLEAINTTNTSATSNACDQVNSAVCRALSQSCVCGPCTSTYETYLNCRVDTQPIVQQGECTLKCNGTTFGSGNSTNRSTSGGFRSVPGGRSSSPSWLAMASIGLYGALRLL